MPENRKNGALSYLAFGAGIGTLVLAALAIFQLSPIYGVICAGTSVAFGIIALIKREKPIWPIMGMIFSVLGVFLGIVIFVIASVVSGIKDLDKEIEDDNDNYNYKYDYSYDDYYDDDDNDTNTTNVDEAMNMLYDTLYGIYSNSVTNTTTTPTTNKYYTPSMIYSYSWVSKSDTSLLDFGYDGTFCYYKDESDLTDYYYTGTYEIYMGKDAVKYVTEDLEEYGVTKQELTGVFDRNEEYDEANFVCIVLVNETCMIGGENTMTTPVTTPYMGFYLDNDVLDIANMNTASYMTFTRK